MAVAAPAVAPSLLSAALHLGDAGSDSPAPAPVVEPASPPPAPVETQRRDDFRRVALSANAEGHFVADASVNGSRVTLMVDTGATTVALTDATARRLGIYPLKSAYDVRLSTANGTVMAARVTLREIRLGGLSVRNVTAVVVPGNALPVDLLGMSFLSRLAKFEIAGRQLVLTQ
jgi:aspartyl protease family protein